MTEVVSTDFDWVSARAACSSSQVFRSLQLEVQTDVEKRNEIRTPNEKSKYLFRYAANESRFSVFVESLFTEMKELEQIGAIFVRTPSGVDVQTLANQLLLRGEITLSNDKKCRIKVGDVEYDSWQFRKLALQNVFFIEVGRWRP
jgi:hypothetical protein